ncbi:beta-ketoacyl synthase N-terminal-like domain-containing protein [Jatrophihabitans sp.]|uniref:beta-ketoacyl synthase N-terminal-like domain-containing protein n=1 Tax=Jatrophihabitans sp. TaxID=1932789 RepID=UPI0030C720D1|nr:3-oxoacyl-(acyl-carrier-protein) synthase [Jatrophihabitans sp.]
MSTRVRVLSAGVVTGAGVGLAELSRVLAGTGPGPRSLADFEPAAHVPFRGTRQLCRTTQLACVAAAEAVAGASAAWGSVAPERRAVSLGTEWGSIGPLAGFNRVVVGSGPQQTLPMSFPNVVVNVHAGHLGIFFDAGGPNLTVCGPAAGLEAVVEAVELIELGRADIALAGASDAGDAPVGLPDLGVDAALLVLSRAEVDGVAAVASYRVGPAVGAARDALEEAELRPEEADWWWDSASTEQPDHGAELRRRIGDCRAAHGAVLLAAAVESVRQTQRPALVVATSAPAAPGTAARAVALVIEPV